MNTTDLALWPQRKVSGVHLLEDHIAKMITLSRPCARRGTHHKDDHHFAPLRKQGITSLAPSMKPRNRKDEASES
eukprot:11168477-Lingulodinium_polyedra.AAC.1